MPNEGKQQATSTELTGGAGFTYEDTIVAYYLAALLREERAAGLNGVVKEVAVQQQGQGHPMDDIIIEFDDDGSRRTLSLQAKRKVSISAAPTNSDFRDIVSRAVETRATVGFNAELDAYGFSAEIVAAGRLRTLNRVIDWAKSSPSGDDFIRRFDSGGAAAAAERSLRDELFPLIGAHSHDDERGFYAQFVALNLSGLTEGGVLRAEVINRLQELVAGNADGRELLLFDRLCRIARDGAGAARKWTRQTLLGDLRGAVRLKVAPNYRQDVEILHSFSMEALADVSEEIAGFRVERPLLEKSITDRLDAHRLVNLSGLPGCGKSAMLKRIASVAGAKGPILFLKSDRLAGSTWLGFATALGLQHRMITDILAEIGSTGTPILFIDGIDRVRPNQKNIIIDVLRAIEENRQLSNWKVMATSRDQGLEAYRAWFPASFYRAGGIGDVSINGFSEEESAALAKEKPSLRRLLFGPRGVSDIARRPFFAAVLARSFPDDSATPQTEVDLISAWWARAGHDAPEDAVPQRQRALLDFADKGVRNLGRNIPANLLKESTFAHVSGLKADLVIRDHDGGASYSFSHDIFCEWVFFRQLIERGDDWTLALADAGEPPLLGRVVGLLAQSAIAFPGKWSAGYRNLERQPLRPQWRREWLTAPPFTAAFVRAHEEFTALLAENEYAFLEKLLVWFQAQHTIPSPIILRISNTSVEGVDPVGMADLLSWPSDVESWGRLLDWLLPRARTLPARMLPNVLELFGVWQNVFADLKNPRSTAIIDVCADWLLELEGIEHSETLTFEHSRWDGLGSEAQSGVATALRTTILRSARSYPAPAIVLFERAEKNERMREKTYSELMAFAQTMADVSPSSVVAVTKAELLEELPQERIAREMQKEREYVEWLSRLRATPEEERTEQQKRALEHVYFPTRRDRVDLDDIGIARHHSYYFPASPIHEPFASLFVKRPDVALGLVRDLANHATKGWHQVQLLNRRRRGTPIPLTLEFPWGRQQFWGDWHVYNWFMGQLAPGPLECAFLALSYWAFNELQRGRPTSEVVRALVEGNECYAVLGLALVVALETYDTSEATFPIATCQRLWHHDLARVVQEPTRDIDVLGFGFLSRLTGERAKAKEFLDSRQSRRREVRDLAVRFALSPDDGLRQRFMDALARFPADLPYEVEEQRLNSGATASLKEAAERWAGLGDNRNYRQHQFEKDKVVISYVPPNPLTAAQEKRLKGSTSSLQEYRVIDWATKSLQANAPVDGLNLADAVAFAKARDTDGILAERSDAGAHSPQTTITAVAAVVIRFGSPTEPEYGWAWDVLERVAIMREPEDAFHGSKIPWHPANHLIVALVHDRRSSVPRKDSVRQLFELTLHPIDSVARFAFHGLFEDVEKHVRWVAAQLAVDLSLHHRFEVKENGERDETRDQDARKRSLARALGRLEETVEEPLTSVPPAWMKRPGPWRSRRSDEEVAWDDPDPSFDATFAARIFPLFPIEAWCQSEVYKPMLAATLKELVGWTAERLMPSWLEARTKNRPDTARSLLIEWNAALGDLLARAAPFLETQFVRKELLSPFLTEHQEGLAVVAAFADMTVTRHIFDAPSVPSNAFDLLNDCLERVIRDRVFDRNGYRAGQVRGYDLPKLVQALLFVSVAGAPGATRFANGDWSQIRIIVPTVTRLVTAIGWSPYVMQTFLTLCERASIAYPLDAFATQVNTVLASLSKGNWAGSMLPARIAAMVQSLADANFPLRSDQAKELLRMLDSLIDLGDRRSAALEQAESFRGVQMR